MKKRIKEAMKKQVHHLIRSCTYSFSGICYCLKEIAFRQELCLGVAILPLTIILPLSIGMRLLLLSLWVALLVVEALNTAIEAIVDLASPEIHELAKKAKDCGSSAVFLVIILNVIAWIIVLINLMQTM